MLSSSMSGTFDVTDAAKSGWNNARPHLSFAAMGGPLAGRDPVRSAGGGARRNATLMYTGSIRQYMAKLYWRTKRNGKWTWRAATVHQRFGAMSGEFVVVRVDDNARDEEE